MHKALAIGLSIAWTAALPVSALAENAEGLERRHDGGKINLNYRYPGDRVIGDGHVRQKGPERGPYVERCQWYARDTFLGLPWGFVQRCQRYTLENTE